MPAGTTARETAPESSRPGAAAQAVLVLLPSATLGWKLQPSEGFPGREASSLQHWDLGQAGNASSWLAALLQGHAQHSVLLPAANITQIRMADFNMLRAK